MTRKRLHWIIPIANEAGYFPTEKQATEINVRAASRYAAHFGGNPPRGSVVQTIHDLTLRQAMDEVMRQRGKVGRKGTGER